MFISSGIDIENYDRAIELIRRELDDTRQGKISQLELDNAKKSLTNSLKAIGDSIVSDVYFTYNQYISCSKLTV